MTLHNTARHRPRIGRAGDATALRPPALRKVIARLEQALHDLMEPGTITYVRQGRFAGTFRYQPLPGSRPRRVVALARDIAREAGLGRVDALDDEAGGIVRLRVELEPDLPRIPIFRPRAAPPKHPVACRKPCRCP